MALLINVQQSNVGVPFEQAYARITGYQGDKDSIVYHVFVSATQEARYTNARDVISYSYRTAAPAEGQLLIPYLYEDLKTRPEFVGSVDC